MTFETGKEMTERNPRCIPEIMGFLRDVWLEI